jgi:hypothetical protein
MVIHHNPMFLSMVHHINNNHNIFINLDCFPNSSLEKIIILNLHNVPISSPHKKKIQLELYFFHIWEYHSAIPSKVPLESSMIKKP